MQALVFFAAASSLIRQTVDNFSGMGGNQQNSMQNPYGQMVSQGHDETLLMMERQSEQLQQLRRSAEEDKYKFQRQIADLEKQASGFDKLEKEYIVLADQMSSLEKQKSKIESDLHTYEQTEKQLHAEAEKKLLEEERRIQEERKRLVKMGMNHETEFNFAFCGRTFAGKSSLINVMRGLKYGDPGYAEVCVGRECTLQTTKYPYSKDAPMFNFWDFPGGGTTLHPFKNYFKDKCLDLFDSILLLYRERFDELDVKILSDANKFNTLDRVAVVYSHTEHGVRDLMRIKGMSRQLATVTFMSEVTADFRTKAVSLLGPKKGNEVPIFFICALTWQENGEPLYEEKKLFDFMVTAAKRRFPNIGPVEMQQFE